MPTEDHSSDRSHQGLPQGGGVELSLDELAKGLATGTLSRGKAIRWMGGALLGAALASLPGVAWANDCRRLGRECRRDSQCCSRNCIRRGDDKVCGCPEGQRRCKDRCVNLQRNENHCGECFNRCAEGEECVSGECQGSCLPFNGTCIANDQCCSGVCSNGNCFCLQNGATCTTNIQCCSNNCSTDGVCSVGGGGCPTNCSRHDRADGTGTVCIDCSVGCPAGITDCSQCPAGTTCVMGGTFAPDFGCGVEC